jgi:NADH:ubiquinone oxidoreductase subunit E
MGACGLGPVMSVDGQTHGRLKPDKIKPLLEKYN